MDRTRTMSVGMVATLPVTFCVRLKPKLITANRLLNWELSTVLQRTTQGQADSTEIAISTYYLLNIAALLAFCVTSREPMPQLT